VPAYEEDESLDPLYVEALEGITESRDSGDGAETSGAGTLVGRVFDEGLVTSAASALGALASGCGAAINPCLVAATGFASTLSGFSAGMLRSLFR